MNNFIQFAGVDGPLANAEVDGMYRRFDTLVRDARAAPELWRLLGGLITVVFCSVVWILGVFLLAAVVFGGETQDFFTGDDSPAETLVILFTIVGLGLGAWGAARLWHGRSLGSLIGRGPRTLRDFVIAAIATWGIAGLIWGVSLPFAEPLRPNLPFSEWLMLLPVALLAILLQTGSEELLFRGYLQSQLAARFRAVWVWMLVPSLIFGALHYLPGDTMAPGLVYVGATALFGVIAADLTARTGSLGAAWGLHFANNCIALLLVVHLGAGSGLGLYAAGTIEEALTLSPVLLVDLALLVVLWRVLIAWLTG